MRKGECAVLGCIALLLLLQPTPALSYVLVFEDTFDGPEINTDIWAVHLNGGSAYIQDGWMYLSTEGYQTLFPFVYTRQDPFPGGCFLYEVRMAYLSATNYGVGNVCNDSLSCSGPYHALGEHCWVIWQDWAHHLVYDYYKQVYGVEYAFDYSPHVYAFELGGNFCTAYMDDDLLGGAYADRRPTYIMFGHDWDVPGYGDIWSSFKVDYVRIWQLDPTLSDQTTWSRIKAQFK